MTPGRDGERGRDRVRTWPNVAVSTNDCISLGGQTIAYPNAVKTTISFLGSATNAGSGGATAAVTVTYANGTTQTVNIVFTDWTEGGGGFGPVTGDVVAITTTYRNSGGNKDAHDAYVFAYSAALTSSQPVASITLPTTSNGGDIHLFDIELK